MPSAGASFTTASTIAREAGSAIVAMNRRSSLSMSIGSCCNQLSAVFPAPKSSRAMPKV